MRSVFLALCLSACLAASASAGWPRASRFQDRGYHPPASALRSQTHYWQYNGPLGGGWGLDTPTMSLQYGIAPQQQFFGPMPYYGGGFGGGFGGGYGYGGYGAPAFGGMGGGW